MAVTEYSCTGNPAADFVELADQCDQGSKIVSVIAFKATVDFSALDNVEATYTALVAANDAYIIGPVTGNWPEASPNLAGKADGHSNDRIKSWSYDVPFSHLNPDDNLEYWTKICKQQGTWTLGFVFEDMTMYLALGKGLRGIPMTINARIGSDDELNGERRMMVNANWKGGLPYRIADMPDAVLKPA